MSRSSSYDWVDDSAQRRTVAELQRHSITTSASVEVNRFATPTSLLLVPLMDDAEETNGGNTNRNAATSSKQPHASILTLIILGTILVLAFIVNNVTWVFVSDDAGQTYAFGVNQITSLMLITLQTPYVLWGLYSGAIPMEHVRAVPWRVLLAMGTIDGIYDTFVSMGSVSTPGPFQTILFQLPIPLTMLLAYFFQRKRFPNGQYVGGIIILTGAIVSVLPGILDVMHNRPQPGSNEGARLKAGSVLIYAIGVFVFSGNVLYKEHSLKNTLVNVWWFSLIVSLINFIVSFFLIPLLWIPGMGHDLPNNTFQHIWAAVRCVLGGETTMDPDARCDGLWWLTLVNVSVNVLVNLLTLQVVRVGSALLLQIVGGVQLPLCNLVYAWKFVMGTRLVTPMTNYMWIGLSLATVGFCVYSFLPLGKPVDPLGETMSTADINEEQRAFTSSGGNGLLRSPTVISDIKLPRSGSGSTHLQMDSAQRQPVYHMPLVL